MQGEESREFEARLREKIVEQDEAVQAVVDLYRVFRAGLQSPGRPVGNLLFLAPTGTGKTRIVEVTAEVLFGDPRGVIKSRLRRIPALARNREADRFASRLFGAPGDASADHPGGARTIPHREIEYQLPVIR